MKNQILLFTLSLSILLTLPGCKIIDDTKDFFSKKPEVTAITEVLKTSLPLAYAANIALDAIAGNVAEHVTIIQGVTSFPGHGHISIKISSKHPLPVGSDTSGTIHVVGLWQADTMAIFSVFFTDLDIKAGTLTISNIAIFPVVRDTNGILVVYANEDVNKGSDTAMTVNLTDQQVQVELARLKTAPPLDSAVDLNQDAWIVTVNNKNTWNTYTDDVYSVCGAGQYAGVDPTSATIVQLVMFGVNMRYTIPISLNPYEGRAVLRTIDVSTVGKFPEIGTAVLTFHSKNDGKVDVTVGIGVYIGSTGSHLPLNLNN